MAHHRLIIDTDPGIDDSMALLLAFDAPELEVVGLTTVYGNADVELTTRNALALAELAGRAELPVARGAEGPLVRPRLPDGWRIHGHNGLGEVSIHAPSASPVPARAAIFLIERIMAQPGELTLLALGPLTNLALALRVEPRIAQRVRQVVVMGGAVNRAGNASPSAEANSRNDPEATQIVLDAAWPVTLVGLDVTHQVIFTSEAMRWLAGLGGAQTAFLHAISRYYLRAYQAEKDLDGFHVHDSTALLYLLRPDLFTTRALTVEVERHSPVHFGMTVADWRFAPSRPANADVCIDVKPEAVLSELRRRLQGLAG